MSRSAGELAAARSLRGADAVHLASALALGRSDTIVAVWDPRLHAGGGAGRIRRRACHPPLARWNFLFWEMGLTNAAR